MASLKLKAPEALPSSGVSTIQFKAWKNQLFAYLEQDTHTYLFLQDGIYVNWLPKQSNPRRIIALLPTDPDVVKLRAKLTKANNARAAAARQADPNNRAHFNQLLDYDQADYDQDQADLLLKRNAQLTKFIALIAVLCHYTKHDDITNRSTSVTWILNHLEKHYNIEKKGAHFMKISEVLFKPGTPYMSYYDEFRSAVQDNLRKQGETIIHNDNEVLGEDEKISSSFESVIVLWALEKINPRLPALVYKRFGHLMVNNTTLMDIHPLVFQQIDEMLETSDQTEANKINIQNQVETEDMAQINYIQNTRQQGRQQRFPRKPYNNSRVNDSYYAARTPNRSYASNRQPSHSQSQSNVPGQRSFCRICKIAGSTPQVFNSHNISACRFLTPKDKDVLRCDLSSLTLHEQSDEEDEMEPFSEPGWDDDNIQE